MSSLNESIKFYLNIEDPNIIFSNYLKKQINGKYHNLYLAELIQAYCPYCHRSNLKHNGHYTSFITADASHPVIIRLKKQRVLCNACLKRSMAQSNLINKGCYISNTSKRKILSALLSSMMILIIYLNTQLLMNSKVQVKSFTSFVQMVQIVTKPQKILIGLCRTLWLLFRITMKRKLSIYFIQNKLLVNKCIKPY